MSFLSSSTIYGIPVASSLSNGEPQIAVLYCSKMSLSLGTGGDNHPNRRIFVRLMSGVPITRLIGSDLRSGESGNVDRTDCNNDIKSVCANGP